MLSYSGAQLKRSGYKKKDADAIQGLLRGRRQGDGIQGRNEKQRGDLFSCSLQR